MKSNEMLRVNAKDDNVEVYIDGAIGNSWFSEGVSAKAFAEAMAPHKDAKNITVKINSPGGLIDDGIAIYNNLKAHPANIKIEIVGAAYSAASFIAMAGDEIHMAENAMFMIHDPNSGVFGDAADMRKEAEILDKFKKNLVETYSARTGKDEEEISKAMADETWYSAQEAFDAGFVTNIMPNKGTGAKNRANLARFNFKRPPAAILNQDDQQMNEPITNEAAPVDPRAEARKFVNAFGAQGGQWFAEGLSFDEAQAKHNAAVKADAEKIAKDLEAEKAKNADLQKRLDEATAESTPVSGGEGNGKTNTEDKRKPKGLEGAMNKVIRIK